MALKSIVNVNVDFYDKKYILINAKQLDKKSRFISVVCYDHGEKYPINSSEHSAYIRYQKADNYGVFNFCDIDRKGNILVELTEQMLASEGICYADLVIVNKGSAELDVSTGEIIAIDNTAILSTMTFCIDVSESPVANSNIESSYEFDGLNVALEKAEAEYSNVIRLARSYAVGDADGIRENEDYDNAKYYYEQSSKKADDASASASDAKQSETNARTYMNNADLDSKNAFIYMNNAGSSATSAKTSETNAANSATNAANSETNAQIYMNNAEEYKNASYDYSVISQRYAVGGTNTVADENIDNAKYYYEKARDIVIGASVIGVKGNNETDYRTGNVNLTADNIGAVASTDVATVDEVKNYLGIE